MTTAAPAIRTSTTSVARSAVSGDTALVGALGHVGAPGTTGAAYFFVRSGSQWTEQTKLLPNGPLGSRLFGRRVALEGDTALVAGMAPDAVHVFERSGGQWSHQQALVPSAASDDAIFGDSIALEGDTAVIGAPRDREGTDGGSAFVFVRGSNQWTEQAKLAPDAPALGAWFGGAVALSGETALIGAKYERVDLPFRSREATVRPTSFRGRGSNGSGRLG